MVSLTTLNSNAPCQRGTQLLQTSFPHQRHCAVLIEKIELVPQLGHLPMIGNLAKYSFKTKLKLCSKKGKQVVKNRFDG
jgi:hypothetical protein